MTIVNSFSLSGRSFRNRFMLSVENLRFENIIVQCNVGFWHLIYSATTCYFAIDPNFVKLRLVTIAIVYSHITLHMILL